MFLKLQFLEGTKRKNWFASTPLESVYVFSKRVSPMRNGSDVDEKGKPWATTVCYAWFVWNHHKNPDTEPVIRWI